jgi:hypothetical protein
MKFSTLILALAFGAASAFQGKVLPSVPSRSVASKMAMETKADLETLAGKLNPAVGYFEPLGLVDGNFWGESDSATIGFLREAEIKHGRIAMFAFVGFCAGSNGIKFPWAISTDGTPFPSANNVPGAQWDALSVSAKVQILGFVLIMELWSEGARNTHYMRGGKAGAFPSFKDSEIQFPHPVPFDLFDPFGFSKKASEEKKASGLIKEINNGRLAMIGIMGCLAESKVEGAVPAIAGKIAHYDGDYMVPFEGAFTFF